MVNSVVSSHVSTLYTRAVIYHLGCRWLMQPKEININGRTKMGCSEGKRIKDLWCICTRTSSVVLGQVIHQPSIAVLWGNHGTSWGGLPSPGRAPHLLCSLYTKDTVWSQGKGSKLSARAILCQWWILQPFISHISFTAGTPGHLPHYVLRQAPWVIITIMTMWH